MMYSVIIPHKNIPKLLERCLHSIPIREDIQIIVVDDSSNEDVIDIIEKLCYQTNAFLIKTTEGKGAGYARNVGLSKATGKWIIFADADDFFYEKAFSILDKYNETDNDVIYFYCDSRNNDTMVIDKDRVPAIKKGIETKDYDLLRYKSSVPWGKMINHSIIKKYKLNFEEIIASNDIMFSVKLGFHAKKVGVVPETLYCVTTRTNSLYMNPSSEKMKSRFFASLRVNQFLYKIGKNNFRNEPLRDLFYFFPSDLSFFFRNIIVCKRNETWKDFLGQLFDTISLNLILYLKRRGLWKK